MLAQPVDDALAGLPVPALGYLHVGRVRRTARRRQDVRRTVAGQHVGALLAGDRAFGVEAQGHAGNAEHGGLLLQAAAVGEDHGRGHHQAEEVEIAQRLAGDDPGPGIEPVGQAGGLDACAGARMHREHHPALTGDLGHGAEDAVEHRRVIHVGRPVQGQHRVVARLQAECLQAGSLGGEGAVSQQGVDHDVADEDDAGGIDTLVAQVGVGAAIGGEEDVGEGIGAQAVEFLGHVAVPRTQAGLHVGHGDAELLRRQCAGQGGVDVAHHQHQVGGVFQAGLLEGQHHPRSLLGVTAGTDAEIDVRARQAEIGKEGLAHPLVVVLAGVYQHRLDPVPSSCHGFHDRRDLHEVGSRTDHVDDFQRRLHGASFCFNKSSHPAVFTNTSSISEASRSRL